MDIQDAWSKALKGTDIIRSRIMALQTFEPTHVPYILLSASDMNPGDTVVRSGQILVEAPSIVLPPNLPHFEGFSFEDLPQEGDALINFLLVRGVSLPSLKYNNQSISLDVFEGGLEKAIAFYGNRLSSQENTSTGLIVAPADVWPFSLLIFICTQISKNSASDIRRLLDNFRRNNT